MDTKTRDSLAIDDLQVGGNYEFLALGKYAYRGVWLGMEGRYGIFDVAPGVMPLFPDGVHIVRDLRWFAACRITAIPRPRVAYEHAANRLIEDALAASAESSLLAGEKAACERRHEDAEQAAEIRKSPSDFRFLLGLLVGSALALVAGVLWWVSR